MGLRPGQAAILTLLVPGLAHFLSGRAVRGALALFSSVGLFLIGYAVLGDRLWFYQAVPSNEGLLRYFPVLLLPEFANFGCTMVVNGLRETAAPDALRHVLLPRPGEEWASMLTGFSGIVTALWASDAFFLARGRASRIRWSPAAVAAASWMLPGAGHWMAGQKSKGVVVGAAVLITFVAGLGMGMGHSVDRAFYTLWWAGQAFCGVGTLFASLVTAPMTMSEYPELLDLGYILCTVAGLMNLMVMTDAYAVAEGTAKSVLPEEATA
jgi:hypothetical protein